MNNGEEIRVYAGNNSWYTAGETKIQQANEKLNRTSKVFAKPIPILPYIVTYENVKTSLKDLSNLPIGINKGNLEISTYNFKRDFINLITAKKKWRWQLNLHRYYRGNKSIKR